MRLLGAEVRRPEILQLFKTHVFGEMPGPLPATRFVTTEEGEALSGRALRRQSPRVLHR